MIEDVLDQSEAARKGLAVSLRQADEDIGNKQLDYDSDYEYHDDVVYDLGPQQKKFAIENRLTSFGRRPLRPRSGGEDRS